MSPLNATRARWIAGFTALYTAIALLLFEYRYLDDLANRHYGTWAERLVEQTTGAYSALVLLPLVIWVTRRFACRPWWIVAGAGLAGAAAYSVLHTTLMALSRSAIYHIFGLGTYDYGIMLYRYPMEASNDVITYATIALIVVFYDRIAQARRSELEAAELRVKLAEANLQNLRLQLHPHFLFNTLNAISSVMYEDVRKADEMLAKLSDFMRLVLAAGDVQHVPLQEELDVERMYVDIMSTRLEWSLRLNVTVDESAHGARVPFMLLQPLLENGIRHGMPSDRRRLDLWIDVARSNGSTIIRVSDDGTGIDPGYVAGVGLKNVRSRLAYLFGDRASMQIGPRAKGGTVATLSFPYADAAGQ